MDWQVPVAALLVLACSAYSAWTLMPAALRRRCRAAFGAPAAEAGGCGGCGGGGCKAPPAATVQVVRVVRRPPGA